ncbi:2-keto-4-pentenoate hydratase [Streptomyces radicis]|uniref:2-keto-4-pentenoate hydratase n=1 Tax=Streptomyces radicis TaxID=1750517 RepID=A0A3A9X2S5_9ACTN|nr:fumarylacetoacetate hydrolase family protein [Streptomyces radicis]RKN12817.1 2-keto-4-pentenoate hydratase [Streptomyces radicis]RKN27418.1 2-keto-4-pentenoate hydratase [Streptomyces radicis]
MTEAHHRASGLDPGDSAALLAAERLRNAGTTGVPTGPVRDLLGQGRLARAYGVQQHNIGLALATDGEAVVGRKIGLTSPAVQRQLGVDQPDYGTLLRSMRVDAGGTIAPSRTLQPKVEAEVAFELAHGIDAVPAAPAGLLPAVARAMPAIEIVDSRVADWDIGIVDTIADNASSGLFVLGDGELTLDETSLTDVSMLLRRHDDTVSHGRGADCLGGPLISLMWLARAMIDLGTPLRRGDVVLSGALGPMVPASPGDLFTATFHDSSRRLDVTVEFSGEET